MATTRCAAGRFEIGLERSDFAQNHVHSSPMHRSLTFALWIQTDDTCEKTLTVAVSKPPAGTKPHLNPANYVADKCTKAWWKTPKRDQNQTCEPDCGWVVDWQGMDAGVAPHPKPAPPPPSEKSGSGGTIVIAIVVVVVLVVLVRLLRFV
jgi:hypothetical protein